MGDVALKLAQIALEGPYTGGTSPLGNSSVYNGGSPQQATRRIAIEKSAGAEFKYVFEAPQEARGTYAGNYQHVLEAVMAAGKLPSLIYCDDLVWYARMTFSGTPTVVTLPTTPTVLLAATAIAGTMNLTTQPNAASDGAAAKILAITLANSAAQNSAVTVTINGTDVNGNTITPAETVVFSAGTTTTSAVGGGAGATSVTLYSVNYYKTVSSIGTSAQPTSDTVAVGGVNAFMWTFKPDMGTSTLYSATMEYFDGSASWQVPGCVAEKMDFTMQIGKSMKSDISFAAQQKVQMPLSGSPITPASAAGTYGAMTKLNDNIIAAMTAFKTKLYSGAIGTDPSQATAINGRLTELKYSMETGAKLGKAADGTPFASFVGREFYKFSSEMTMLFNSSSGATFDPVDVGNFLYPTVASRTFRAVMPGPNLPCGAITQTGGNSGWPNQLTGGATSAAGMYGLILDMAGKVDNLSEKDVDGRMALSFKLMSEVDLTFLQAQAQMIVISRVNPNAY